MKTTRCQCIALRRVTKTVTAYYDDKLKPCGLTINQFALLRTLAKLDSPSVSELAKSMLLDRSTLVRTLRPLFAAGMIEDRSAAGTRDRSLKLTEKGEQTIAAAKTLWDEAQRGFEEHIGAENLHTWSSLLELVQRL